MGSQTKHTGATQALTANAFTRSGYTFDGWNTAADGSGTPYADAAEFSMSGEGEQLYAMWQEDVPEPTPTETPIENPETGNNGVGAMWIAASALLILIAASGFMLRKSCK